MPGKVKVKISSGKNLPVMDRSSDTTDAYVEIKLGGTTFKTDVCRKSLHPQWNTDWYRFEVEDSELQDEPLQIRLMDHDTYSANDAIGKVYLNLNPLLLPGDGQIMKYGFNGDSSIHHEISGWLPVYDTMHGIRGEVNITVKVELFSDFNRYRQSSCGVQFFYSPTVPQIYQAKLIHGFVEELVVYDDPEYQWIDKIRTPRASNEARQTLFFKLSGELQRKIGVKTLNLGGNAVIGYKQSYDLEGESGIVARGIGTAVTLIKSSNTTATVNGDIKDEHVKDYLEFVGDGKSLRLSSTPKVLPYLSPAFSRLPKLLNLAPSKSKRLSKKLYTSIDSSSIRSSRSIENITHNSMESLLKQENERGKSGKALPLKFKSLKFSRKMSALKSKLKSETDEESEKKPYKRSESESSFMAEILARSVIHAHNSVTSILEVKHGSLEGDLNKTASEPTIASANSSSEGRFSSTESSTSEDDDYIKASEKDLDTISTIIRDVERLELKRKQTYLKQCSLPFDLNITEDSTEPKIEVEAPTKRANFEIFYENDDDEDNEETFKGIIPEAMKNVEIKEKGLVKTAIQALLLDKASLIGTYSPPTSPIREQPFPTAKPPIVRQKSLPKSASSINFDEYIKHNETVLGVPFTQIVSYECFKRRVSQPCLAKNAPTSDQLSSASCFSDNQLNRPLVKTMLTESLQKETPSRFRIFGPRKARRPRIRSYSTSSHKSFLSRIFSQRKLRPSADPSDPSTSRSRNELTRTNATSPPDQLPVNIKIEGNICSDTKHACVTPNRHNMSPQPDQIGSNCQQSLEAPRRGDQSPSRLNVLAQRRSSDSDLSTTPKGNSLTSSEKSGGHNSGSFMKSNILRSQINQENFDMLEYPFLTVMKFPADFIAQIGGAVSARSVKRLETIRNIEEPESRDTWWSELRMEIRSHARSLNCNAVLGYSESASINDDICILSAYGTAVVINFHKNEEDDYSGLVKQNVASNLSDVANVLVEQKQIDKDKHKNESSKNFDSPEHGNNHLNCNCSIAHLPYEGGNKSLKATLSKCMLCRKGKVPEVLIATIEPPEGLPSTGRGCFIESYVCRPLKDLKGEWIAKEISDGLPFLEYELHRLLVNKLKIKGMNAIFGLKFGISVGERLIIATANGTAMYLAPLPPPTVPKLVSDENSDDAKVLLLQKQLNETVKRNREIYQIDDDSQNCRVWSDDESEEEPTSLDLSSGSKDCCVLEVDDPKDEEILFSLMKERPPDGFHVVNTESIPGLDDMEIVRNLQMFTQVRRFKFHSNLNIDEYFSKLLESVYFKLRRMVPCALCNIQFRCGIPEPDEVQLLVFGMALGLGKKSKKVKMVVSKRNDEDMIFKLDEDSIPENAITKSSSVKYRPRTSSKYKSQSLKQRHTPQQEINGVDVTPLSYVPGASVDKYLGNINFFFIRETTSIREEGGLSGFLHSFVTEVLAIVRAHVSALGGNALIAFFLTELFLHHNFHKNQGQCLINVGGDVVSVTYFNGET
ncbi:unnamed protein product [Phyllotreta striolata]|uniref:C2 domain-containing protein n=1 Tax=Phyllotreta striolata TaxID=444603 RepID=A0A9N9XKL0_PHYSR|nr:unnamed protein product [Phyllotreta striolata]